MPQVLAWQRWSLRWTAAAALAGTHALAHGARADSDWDYRIVRGDTLIALSAEYLRPGAGGWQALQRHNAVADPRRLRPGRLLHIPMAWLRSESRPAEIVFAQGTATVLAPGQSAPSPARAGQAVPAGSSLRTAAQSSMVVRFGDGSRLLVTPDTQVTLEQLLVIGRAALPSTRLRLDQGNVDSQVVPQARTPAPGNPPYEIRTPLATLGVRGTVFRAHMDADAGRAGVEVLAGSVRAAARQGVVVAAGFGTIATAATGVLPPLPLLAAPLLPALPAVRTGVPLDLAWAAVEGAAGYRAQVIDGATGAIWLESRTPAPAAHWDAAPPAGDYRLRVRAVDGRGVEGLDGEAPFAVQVAAAPAGFEPLWPVPGGVVSGDAIGFRWRAADGGRRYRLQVSDNADFSTLRVDLTDEQPVPAGEVERRVLLPTGRYHWRVAIVGEDGSTGPFTTPRNVDLVDAR